MFDPNANDINRTHVVYRQSWMKPKDWEFGVITSFNDILVHVRYKNQQHSKGTYRKDLSTADSIRLLDIDAGRYLIPSKFTETHVYGLVIDAISHSMRLKVSKVAWNTVVGEADNAKIEELEKLFKGGWTYVSGWLDQPKPYSFT